MRKSNSFDVIQTYEKINPSVYYKLNIKNITNELNSNFNPFTNEYFIKK